MAGVNNIENIDYQKLHLDMDNLRLPSNVPKTAKGILTWIAKATAIEDLMNAIGTNDFLQVNPVSTEAKRLLFNVDGALSQEISCAAIPAIGMYIKSAMKNNGRKRQ